MIGQLFSRSKDIEIISRQRAKPLSQRCLELTARYETGLCPPGCYSRIAGDFDGQGLSYGALQWNIGQGTIQDLLIDAVLGDTEMASRIFGDDLPELMEVLRGMGREEQLHWVRSKKWGRHTLWGKRLQDFGLVYAMQEQQVLRAYGYYKQALDWCVDYDLWSERAVALMFDIRVQNGSIQRRVQAQIREELTQEKEDFPMASPDWEEHVLEKIANRRAEAANERWVEDVRARKLCIALGEGKVHGKKINVADEYGIRLEMSQELSQRKMERWDEEHPAA